MEQSTSEKKSSTDLKHCCRKSTLVLWCLMFIMSVTVILGVWYLWRTAQIQLQQIHQQVEAKNHEVQAALLQTHTLLDEQKAQWVGTQNTLNMLINNQPKPVDITRIQIDALVQQAMFHLTFEKNVPLALQWLEAADQVAKNSQDVTLLPVQKALVEKTTILKAVPTIDVVGITAKLGALSVQAEDLSQTPVKMPPDLAGDIENTQDESVSMATKTKVSVFWDSLKKIVKVAGRELSNMVVISKSDQCMPAMLSQDQRISAILHLQAQLDLAQWAVVHQNTDIYQQNLSQADHVLRHYFSAQDIQVQAMLKTLDELKILPVSLAIPDMPHFSAILTH